MVKCNPRSSNGKENLVGAHCSFQDLHSLSKENPVSLVSTFFLNQAWEVKSADLGVEGGKMIVIAGLRKWDWSGLCQFPLGACAMTTKFLDCTNFKLKILLSWRFPRKTGFWDDIPVRPPTPPPLKNANFIFIVVSPSLIL